MKKKTPKLVKAVSITFYIFSAVLALMGLMLMIGSQAIAPLMQDLLGPLTAVGTAIFMIIGIVYLGFGVLYFFMAKELLKGKNWARIVAIILVVLGILGGLSSLANPNVASIILLLVDIGIAYVLMIDKESRVHFA